ncbi:heavy metal-binding domain-containing protein [Kitasatospora sp. NPDC058965]|uniref:heavy metal-binding domain-containing protein n=1 Tax=Kitasatospora sp. NPDC058965 TaxID=3346682 RepID=UPI0036A5ABBA
MTQTPGGRGAWAASLSPAAVAAVRAVGFEPVGLASGAGAFHVEVAGDRFAWHPYSCGFPATAGHSRARSDTAPVQLSGAGAPSSVLVDVLDGARLRALERLGRACTALGGDGVLGVRLTAAAGTAYYGSELTLTGTAVRARGPVRAARPFSTHLDGPDFAKLIGAGWVPVELLVGRSIGVRHEDRQALQQQGTWSNAESVGWSALVNAVRADARDHLAGLGARTGADTVVLGTAALELDTVRCPLETRAPGQRTEPADHRAQFTCTGTAITRFATAPDVPRPPLTVLPLTGRRTSRR